MLSPDLRLGESLFFLRSIVMGLTMQGSENWASLTGQIGHSGLFEDVHAHFWASSLSTISANLMNMPTNVHQQWPSLISVVGLLDKTFLTKEIFFLCLALTPLLQQDGAASASVFDNLLEWLDHANPSCLVQPLLLPLREKLYRGGPVSQRL